jgi:hypothetical protein
MPVTVNSSFALIVDEDQGTPVSDPDELAWSGGTGFQTYDATLRTAVLAIAPADATTDFPTPQLAVEGALIELSGTVQNLSLVSTLAGAEYPVGGINSGLTTADGTEIWLFEGPTEDIVVGRIGDSGDADGQAAFIIVLDEDKSSGSVTDAKVWIIQYAAISHDDTDSVEGDLQDLQDLVFVASTSLEGGTHVFSDFSDVPAGAPVFAMIADDTPGENAGDVDFLVTAFKTTAPATPITVNVSNQGSFPGSLASGSQNITPGTGLRFDLVTDGNNNYTQKEGKLDTKIAFGTHAEAVEAGFTVVQNQGGRPTDILIKAYNVSDSADDDDGHSFFTALSANQQTSEAITDVRVFIINADGTEGTLLYDNTGGTNPNLIPVTINGDGSVLVENVMLNYTVQIGTAAGFERFTVTNVSPESNAYIDLGRLTYTTDTSTEVGDVSEIGSLIQIDDSGPTILASAVTTEALAVDDDTLGTNATADFSSLFTTTNGADGAASGSPTYALDTPGGASGLVDAQSDQAIQLRANLDGSVEGYVTLSGTDTTVFLLTVSTSGVVTLDQQRAIEHVVSGVATDSPVGLSAANLVTLSATITDNDGDHQTVSADIGGTLSFADAQPGIAALTDMSLSYIVGQNTNQTFDINLHNDIAGAMAFVQASLIYDGPLTPVFVSGILLEFQDGNGDSVFHVDLTSGDCTVTVDQSAAPGAPQPLLFSGITAGGPQESLSVELADHSDRIIFNGLLTDGSGELYDPAGATTNDDLNPDSLGFGVKGGQASQINPGEGWTFSTLSERELDNLTFHIQGIGGIKTVTVEYDLYEDNGTADVSDDVLVYHGSRVVAIPSGNNTVEVVIDDADNGESFDYGVMSFLFPANTKTGIVDANQGIRVRDFTASEVGPSLPDHFSIGLVGVDTDQDTFTTNVFRVDLTI